MILVITTGTGSMDMYSRKLAEHLIVPLFQTDIYQRFAESRNISWLSLQGVSALWANWRFARKLNKLGGIIHLPNHHLGRYGNYLKIPFIITVHDLIRYFDLRGYGVFIHPPNLRDSFYLNLDYKGIKKAIRIIAVSQATKNDLVQYLHIPKERISVVYQGVEHNLFRPVPERIYQRPYILFVGSEHPRKNLGILLKAFSRLKREPRFGDLRLVKVSLAGGREAEFRKKTMELIDALDLHREVIFTEFLPEADLPLYYSGAKMLVLPSLYEGFGLPALEAMACGCPVITSAISSLPEVVKDASIKVDPYDIDGLTQAIRQVLDDDELRKDMIRKGLERAGEFSWEKTGAETQRVYNEVEKEVDQYGWQRVSQNRNKAGAPRETAEEKAGENPAARAEPGEDIYGSYS